MNIHLKDKKRYIDLKSATITKCQIGSHCYGTHNEKSDIDLLHIYATSNVEQNTFLTSHHQIQYHVDGNDEMFVSLHNFIKNILNGDSPINFEVIHSGQLDNTEISFLSDMKDDFITYTLIRSYLGLARRDSKHFHKAKDEYSKFKKLGHIIRTSIYIRDMLDYNFDFNKANEKFKTIKIDVSNNKQLKEYDKIISDLRNELNEKLNSGELKYAQKFDVFAGINLHNKLMIYCSSLEYNEKKKHLNDFDILEFIDANENCVNY